MILSRESLIIALIVGLLIIQIKPLNAVTANHLVISEVLYNPEGSEPHHEWIEIYNPTGNPICIDGWSVDDGEGSWMVPDPTGNADYILEIGGYITLANNADSFNTKYGYSPDMARIVGSTTAIGLILSGSVWLNNTSDQVFLRGFTDSLIDALQWGNNYESPPDSIWYPLPPSPAAEDSTILRVPPGDESIEVQGAVSESLAVYWIASGDTNVPYEGPNTGGLAGIDISTHPNPCVELIIPHEIIVSNTVIEVQVNRGMAPDRVCIFNVAGRRVEELRLRKVEKNLYKTEWHPGELPTGIYLITLPGGNLYSKKVLFLR